MAEQFTGVLLQMLPVAIMMGAPFEEEEFRVKRKYYYIASVFIIVICASVFAALAVNRDPNIDRYIFGNSLMGASVFVFVIYFFYIFRTKALKKLIILGIGCSYAAIVFLVNSLIVRYVLGVP